MNSLHRDLLILILFTGGVFAAIYGWIAYSGESDSGEEKQEQTLFGEEFEERLASSFEEQLTFINNHYTREFETTLRQRFNPHLDASPGLRAVNTIKGNQINAFTTLGDRIYLFEGLITQIDDPRLVAAVVAHELGHIYHSHVEKQLKIKIGTSLLLNIITGGNQGMIVELGRSMMTLSFNRSQELQADDFARELLERAGMHPHNLAQAFLRMKTLTNMNSQPDFLSSHPSLEERIERILKYEVPAEFEERPLQFPWQELTQTLGK